MLENLTYRLSYLKGRILQNLQKPAFCPARTLLIDHKANFLTWNSIFYNYFFSIYVHISLVREINFLDNSFVNLSFFHKSSIK